MNFDALFRELLGADPVGDTLMYRDGVRSEYRYAAYAGERLCAALFGDA